MHTFHPTCTIIRNPVTGLCQHRGKVRLRRGKMVRCPAKGFALTYRTGTFKTHDGQRYTVTNGTIRRA